METDSFTLLSADECRLRLPFILGSGIEKVEISLSDSVTGGRIRFPGRGRRCDHIDVVDLVTSVGRVDPEELLDDPWVCPVCGTFYTDLKSLEIDGLLMEAFSSAPESCLSIMVNRDGSWTSSLDDETAEERDSHRFMKLRPRELSTIRKTQLMSPL